MTAVLNAMLRRAPYFIVCGTVLIRKFGNEVIKCFSQMTLNPVPKCSILCILNLYPNDCMLNSKERKLADICATSL